MNDKIEELLNNATNTESIQVDLERFFVQNNVSQYEISVDDMFDSPGLDVYSVSVAWIYQEQLYLRVGQIASY